jgi:hypothetical protein
MGVGQSLEARIAADLAHAAELERQARTLRQRADRSRVGLEGEIAVAAVVAPLAGAGWFITHDRGLANSPANIDHVLVGPGLVAVVDAKNYAGRLSIRDEDHVFVDGWPRSREVDTVRGYASSVRAAVEQRQPTFPVLPVICFIRDVGLAAPVQARGVTLLQLEQLNGWLEERVPLLTPHQVWGLGEHLEKTHPPRTRRQVATTVSPPPPSPPRPVGRPPKPHRGRATQVSPALSTLLRLVLVLVVLGALLAVLPHLLGHLSPQLPKVPTQSPGAPVTASTR